MKLAIYSDLHLEFGNPFKPDAEADLMILSGDIIVFDPRGFEALREFLKDWTKPVLMIAGNHEYYTKRPMSQCDQEFIDYCAKNIPNLTYLQDHAFELDGVHFFGGTMWTDFNKSHVPSMKNAERSMNDYYQIRTNPVMYLQAQDTVEMHDRYKKKLVKWLEKNKGNKRVVISHHAPCLNPNSEYGKGGMKPAYNSLDMVEIIEKYQPELWCYGHCHEFDDQMIGKTRIVSNPFGYYDYRECGEFDPKGMLIEI